MNTRLLDPMIHLEERAFTVGDLTITVVRRMDDFMAYVNGDKSVWGCGQTIQYAIGQAIITATIIDALKGEQK